MNDTVYAARPPSSDQDKAHAVADTPANPDIAAALDGTPRPKRGLRRRLMWLAAGVFLVILAFEGMALVGLERLDGVLREIQSEASQDARKVLLLAESTAGLSLAADRFTKVRDRQALFRAEADLRAEIDAFSEMARQLPTVHAGAETPSPMPPIINAANRLDGVLRELAATAGEAIDAHAGMNAAEEDLGNVKAALLHAQDLTPANTEALALASMAVVSDDPEEVKRLRATYRDLVARSGRPMALGLLTPLFDRRLTVLDVEARQASLVSAATVAAAEVASLGRRYGEILDLISAERVAELTRALSLGKLVAIGAGLIALLAAFFIANAFLRGVVADLTGIAEAMRRLSKGDTSARVPGTARTDEIGALADAFAVFKSQVIERARMARTLQQAERLEAIGRLTGGIVHDFNNILTAITTNAQLIHDDADPASPARTRALRTLEAAERGSAMVQQLLTFGRRRPLAPEATDIDAMIAAIVDLVSAGFGEGVALRRRATTAGDGRPLLAHVDPEQLENALINLLFNARDAVANAGTIEIAAELSPDGDVRITVADDGCGMTPDVLDHIFEPFFSTKPAHAGSGLGLATVYGFVRQSGGEIAVTSEPCVGTRVMMDLPRFPRVSAT
ncbi:sensor histidine kinase [Consotaella salsifontis]|uniref:histidine kinase n=1 Tax=Consotaella salsifontis TaxID=1365950 RepID=A0A1T4PJI4_9HYPH|nr:ATP-binding protein [Consotaella salsifontis]SJZ91417.1 HAMP domain-containing protein [Consotaella salsifontis]